VRVLAAVALKARKTVREHAATQEARERLVYKRWRAAFIARHFGECRALLRDETVQHSRGRVARQVLGRRGTLRGAGKHGRGSRKVRADVQVVIPLGCGRQLAPPPPQIRGRHRIRFDELYGGGNAPLLHPCLKPLGPL
jgi:hypothetical protein